MLELALRATASPSAVSISELPERWGRLLSEASLVGAWLRAQASLGLSCFSRTHSRFLFQNLVFTWRS